MGVTLINIDHEARMVQSRILSPFLKIMEDKGITENDLSKASGLTLDTITKLFLIEKPLKMAHIALIQKGLDSVAQPPEVITAKEHHERFYKST